MEKYVQTILVTNAFIICSRTWPLVCQVLAFFFLKKFSVFKNSGITILGSLSRTRPMLDLQRTTRAISIYILYFTLFRRIHKLYQQYLTLDWCLMTWLCRHAGKPKSINQPIVLLKLCCILKGLHTACFL